MKVKPAAFDLKQTLCLAGETSNLVLLTSSNLVLSTSSNLVLGECRSAPKSARTSLPPKRFSSVLAHSRQSAARHSSPLGLETETPRSCAFCSNPQPLGFYALAAREEVQKFRHAEVPTETSSDVQGSTGPRKIQYSQDKAVEDVVPYLIRYFAANHGVTGTYDRAAQSIRNF